MIDNLENQNTNDFYYNSNMRKNILKWYPFKEKSKILQIGVDSIKLVEELIERAEELTILVNNESEKNSILNEFQQEKLSIETNLDTIIDNQEQYDYIVLIGTIENYKNLGEKDAYKKLEKLLQILKNKCKLDGKILLAVDNKFGIKFWTSLRATNNIICNNEIALSKRKIDSLLLKYGFHYKYYYVLPDYKMTNVIFTEEYLPDAENISRNFNYGSEEFKSFYQTEAYAEIIKEDSRDFMFFANSYFIEISQAKLEDNEIRFVSYTNIRKEKYKIQTIIYKDIVEKTYLNKYSKRHLENIKNNIDIMNNNNIKTLDSYTNEKIISKYVENFKSYDKILIKLLQDENEDEFFNKIDEYKKNLLKTLNNVEFEQIRHDNIFTEYEVEYSENDLRELNFVKDGLWDLIFQNAFYIDGELYYYDQEWYSKNVPVEFIIYRAIAYFPSAHSYITSQQLYKRLGLEKYLTLFRNLDMKLQEEIRDDEIWKKHRYTKTGQTLIDLYKNLQKEYRENLDEMTNKNSQLLAEVESIKQELINVLEKLKNANESNEKILNSTSWKITKPIRWFGKNLK